MPITQISRFIEGIVTVAQRVTGDGGEFAAFRGGGFADYALVSLYCLRIYLDSSHRMTIDLLKEMPQITEKIGLNAAILIINKVIKSWIDIRYDHDFRHVDVDWLCGNNTPNEFYL